jgi:hypothetical protein
MTAAGVRYPPRPRRIEPVPEPRPAVAPSLAGQLLPSRSLRALRAVLDRYVREAA